MLNCFVYFIDNGHEEIKIGKANRVEERRKQGEILESQQFIEAYGEHDRAMVQALMC